MADSKITALTSISTSTDPANDPLVIVDVSDTSMAATGTTKKVTLNQLLGASGTATLASATITGDLTVDTSTLKVDSANNRVGIGTASPSTTAHIVGGNANTLLLDNGGQQYTQLILQRNGTANTGGDILVDGTGATINYRGLLVGDLVFQTSTSAGSPGERYRIASNGVATWSNVGGVAGTAMTLNATGLGVGTSPATKLDVNGGTGGAGGQNHATFSGNAGRGLVIGTRSDSVSNDRTATLNAPFTGGSIVLQTQGTDRLLVDSSGNVGIGVTPSAWSATFRSLDIGSGALTSQPSQQSIGIYANAFENGTNYTRKALGFAAGYSIYNGAHYWLNAASGAAGSTFAFGSAVMTLDASGNLLVGDTAQSSNERLRVNNTASNGWAVTMTSTTRGWLNRQSDANGGIAAYFEVGSGNTNVGSINTTSSGTSFVTTSDYRLKEAVQPLVGGLARISALKPSIYKWKVDGSSGEGFLAHELAEVVPFAVTGEKDAVNEDGSIKPQGVDLSKVVPILVAAIQELTARVQTLETR